MMPVVIAAEGAAFALLAGLDGSVTWQAARVLMVVVVTAWAVWFTRLAGRAGRGATAFALGIAGTAAGAGTASAQLAKARLDVAAAAAGVVLVTGVILLVWGAAAVSFLGRQSGVRPGKIAVLGESMGGEQALAAVGSDSRIRAVVAEGATGQQLADHGWLPDGGGEPCSAAWNGSCTPRPG